MLTEKELELIAVGASIAAGCKPCTTHHFRAARIAGAGEDEIHQAVSDALYVRRGATEIMARLADRPGIAAEPEPGYREDTSLIRELVSMSAAYAVNCVTSFERHLAAGREQGAANDDILAAVKVACGVKDVAGKKVQSAAVRALGGNENEGAPCGCGDGGAAGEPAQTAGGSDGCADGPEACGCQG